MEPGASGSNFENYQQPEDTVISVSPATMYCGVKKVFKL